MATTPSTSQNSISIILLADGWHSNLLTSSDDGSFQTGSELYLLLHYDAPKFHPQWWFTVKLHLSHGDNVPNIYVGLPTTEPYAVLTNSLGHILHTLFENVPCHVRGNMLRYNRCLKHLRFHPLWFVCLPSPYLQRPSHCSQLLILIDTLTSLSHMEVLPSLKWSIHS
jgi:hypothetical protein